MHHHGGSGSGGGYLNILPLWLQVVWALLLAGVTAMHLLTLGFARGRARAWTGAHTLMGLGMLYMYVPWAGPPVTAAVLVVVFGALAWVSVLSLIGGWDSDRPTRMMWVLVTVDMAAMAYMYELTYWGFGLLTYAAAGWYLAMAVVWFYGIPDASLTRCCAVPFGIEHPVPPLSLARAAQTVMSVGMAWMFLAMDPTFGSHLDAALGGGLHEQAYWVVALSALLVRFAADPVLVRQLVAPLWLGAAPVGTGMSPATEAEVVVGARGRGADGSAEKPAPAPVA